MNALFLRVNREKLQSETKIASHSPGRKDANVHNLESITDSCSRCYSHGNFFISEQTGRNRFLKEFLIFISWYSYNINTNKNIKIVKYSYCYKRYAYYDIDLFLSLYFKRNNYSETNRILHIIVIVFDLPIRDSIYVLITIF